ncbi:hypothetical protein QBC43DRAFT_363633 [Cladorrhinum sp. PSN259]|nr:hypothetical protein QBC43DRAFT_363633 [Cladorrhinum sp. PSN259]
MSMDRTAFFSQKGDSGSAIFDFDGQVGGILDAGSGTCYPSLDLTYLTSIAWIMEDIEAKVGRAAFL